MAQQFVALCRDGDLEGVRAALQGGADVNTKFADILYGAMNGLTWALINKHTEVASLLLAHEDIKADALERAKAVEFVYYCTRNELENVKSALQSGTDVNSRDEEFRNGWTGLIAALHNGFNTELSSFLLRQDGIDVNFVGGHFDHWGGSVGHGITALYAAVHNMCLGHQSAECLAMLLARPDLTTINQKTSDGPWTGHAVTPLWLAVHHQNVKAVQLLLSDNRTDPNIKNDGDYDYYDADYDEYTYLSSCTPLSVAVNTDCVEIVELLLSDGRTDPNMKDDGQRAEGNSPLMLAVKKNRVACVKLLLADPRVDLMTKDNYRWTPKEMAR